MSRAWAIDAFGIDRLRLGDRPTPEPGPGQAVVRVRAASLNYRDLLMVRGEYDPRVRLPLVPCSDAAGEVVAVGAGVDRLRPGDRVCPLFSQAWVTGPPADAHLKATLGGPRDGALAEHLLVEAAAAVHVPAHLSDVEAATLPCAAVTAWRALVTGGGVAPGHTVLVIGTGGVSLFALQIARGLGARVVVVSGSDEKLERARALGAAHVVNRLALPKWGRAVREWAGSGVDHVVEVGGAGSLDESLQAVRVGGTVSIIGVLAGAVGPVNLNRVLMRSVRLQGVFVGSGDDFDALNGFLAANPSIRPVVDRVFPFESAAAAFAHLAAQGHFGKVVVAGAP